MKWAKDFLARFAGKKQATALGGLAVVLALVIEYVGLPAPEREAAAPVFAAAVVAVGVLVAGFAIGQGIGDSGERGGRGARGGEGDRAKQ